MFEKTTFVPVSSFLDAVQKYDFRKPSHNAAGNTGSNLPMEEFFVMKKKQPLNDLVMIHVYFEGNN